MCASGRATLYILVHNFIVSAERSSYHRASVFFLPCFQVLIKNWVNGEEQSMLVGVEAQFGTQPPMDDSKALKSSAVLANPLNCCADSSSKVSVSLFFLIYISQALMLLFVAD